MVGAHRREIAVRDANGRDWWICGPVWAGSGVEYRPNIAEEKENGTGAMPRPVKSAWPALA